MSSTISLWACAATLPISAVQKYADCTKCLCWLSVQFNLIYMYILFKIRMPYLAGHFPNSYQLAFKGSIALHWYIWGGRHWIAWKTSVWLLPIQHWDCTEIWTSGQTVCSFFFYRYSVQSEIYIGHSPTNALFIKLGKV